MFCPLLFQFDIEFFGFADVLFSLFSVGASVPGSPDRDPGTEQSTGTLLPPQLCSPQEFPTVRAGEVCEEVPRCHQ